MAGVKDRKKMALRALDQYARDLDEALREHKAAGDLETAAELQKERELVRQAEILLLAGDSIDSTQGKA